MWDYTHLPEKMGGATAPPLLTPVIPLELIQAEAGAQPRLAACTRSSLGTRVTYVWVLNLSLVELLQLGPPFYATILGEWCGIVHRHIMTIVYFLEYDPGLPRPLLVGIPLEMAVAPAQSPFPSLGKSHLRVCPLPGIVSSATR